jgi:hypothetical protein
MLFGRRSAIRDEQRRQNDWFLLMLIVMVPLYWIFARYLERVDLGNTIGQWWQMMVPFLPMPRLVVFIAEMLHPRVLRHLSVIVVGWFLARSAAVSLVQTLYDLPDRGLAELFMSRLRSSGESLGRPVLVNGRSLEEDRESSVLLRVGGPGLVLIDDREAVVSELNGRFHRVVGPGINRLDRLEYIYAALDLRQQERVAEDVPLMTKDGIEIRAGLTITYRISSGDEPPTRARPYPYDENAVRLAAYAETVDEDGYVLRWDDIPLAISQTTLAGIIARYQLDQLLYPENLASDPNLTIRNELERRVRTALESVGIMLTGLHIGRLELPEPVIEQYIEYWQTHWETQSQLKEADGEAFKLEEVEVARAEAEITMIRAIVEGLQRAQLNANTETIHEVVALHLIEALEKVAEQSEESSPLPADLMPQLTALREQLLLGRGNT